MFLSWSTSGLEVNKLSLSTTEHIRSDQLTQNTNSPPESGRIFIFYEVNELLHDDVCLTLPVLDVQHELVPRQDVWVLVDVGHRHDSDWPQFRGCELGPGYRKYSA